MSVALSVEMSTGSGKLVLSNLPGSGPGGVSGGVMSRMRQGQRLLLLSVTTHHLHCQVLTSHSPLIVCNSDKKYFLISSSTNDY